MKKFLLAAGFMYLCSCSVTAPQSKSITGKWMMSEYLIDIGDGQGTWQPADSSMKSVTEFFADGTFKSNDPLLKNKDHYKLLTDSIQFSGNQPDLYPISFLHADTMVIRPHCVEACGYKYVRTR